MSTATARFLGQQAVLATRRLWNAPRFVALSVLTLAAGIAPSLIFDQVGRAVLLPLPFERSQDLVRIWQQFDGSWRGAGSYPRLADLRAHSRAMDVAAETGGTFFLGAGDRSVPLAMAAVTPNYFEVLAVRPLLGRAFRDDDNLRPFEHPVAVLSERVWRSHFGARVSVVGQTVVLNDQPFAVVGIMPPIVEAYPGFRRDVDVWVPAMMAPLGKVSGPWRETALAIESPHAQLWCGVARLRPGHTLREARTEAAVLGRQALARWPADEVSVPFVLVRMAEDAIEPRILNAVTVLKAAGLLVLVVCGLNLASLFLARGLERTRSLAVHALMGASPGTLLRASLWEALVVGVLGAAAALVLARGLLAAVGFVEPTALTAPFGLAFDPAAWGLDWRIAFASVVASVLLSFACAVGPALRAARGASSVLWRGGAGIVTGGIRQLRLSRAGGLIIAVEMALALALTVPTILMTRSLAALITADVGFRPESVVTAELQLPSEGAGEVAAREVVTEATRRLRGLDGVAAAAWVSCLPIQCAFFDTELTRPGSGTRFSASVHVVTPEAFRVLGIPLRDGRAFTPDDGPAGRPVVILSERAALLLGGGVVGSRVVLGTDSHEVVGVVGDVPYRDLASEVMPAAYFPLKQRPLTEGVLVVRSARGAAEIKERVAQVMAVVAPAAGALGVTTLEARVDREHARFRGAAWLLGAAAVLALLLCGLGAYGIVSSHVTRSLPEIGVRMALGATGGRVAWSIGLALIRLALAGLLVGTALGTWSATYLRQYLFGVRPWDLPTVLVSLLVALFTALLAAWRPAGYAGRLDPVTVLRSE